MKYKEFLDSKARVHPWTGIEPPEVINPKLFDWQDAVVRWALRKGRACLFEDCGLGKGAQALSWASCIPGDVLLVAPLSVSHQFEREAEKFGVAAKASRDGSKTGQITITNYESMHKFDMTTFTGVVLDESSRIKAHDSKTRNLVLSECAEVPHRLACTATPAPNDHMELGNHAEFVGAMSRVEMLATFFIHDGGNTSKWRLKGHARAEFWKWVASWAMMLRTPADIGYPDDGYVLPELRIHTHEIKSGIVKPGELFTMPAQGLRDQRAARRETMDDRVRLAASIVNETDDAYIVWAELNAESTALTKAITGSVEVTGSQSDDEKEAGLNSFSDGEARVLVSKPKIAAFGLNMQHCNNMLFVGLSHSWEQFYQAVRREWRFGQEHPVDVHIISTDIESGVLANIQHKQAMADEMISEMVGYMRDTMMGELKMGGASNKDEYTTDVTKGDKYTAHLGDCVDVVGNMDSESTDYTIYSPPFSSLYTYSASDRDMGNTSNDEEFMRHYKFLVAELYRVTKPGRLLSFHCMDLPSSKQHHGVIGLRDFRGELIRVHEECGWILHSQVVIWKDPVTAMQRTKALGLLWKQIKKDSAMSRQGIPDYLVTMRKPGVNPEPISHTPEEFPVELWQNYASPVWMDINPSTTLQHRSAREEDDERHLCPLQTQVIERALKLWSNPSDLVLSPFMGIGSEGHVAIEEGRRFVGVELKRSYYDQACKNLAVAGRQLSMFG